MSNFNETEQIVLIDPLPENGVAGANRGRVDGRERLSFVQIRGSVPLYWAEVNNLRYKPDLQIMEKPETVTSMKKHLYNMVDKYQSVYLVNLINQKGYEQPVKEAFERYITQATADHTLADRAHYVYFDFHHECRKNRFDRIQVLIDRLAEPLNRMGYFYGHANASSGFNSSPATPSKVISKQSGVIRSNCMDCLDRTNVAQAALAKWALNEQLRKVGVLSPKESVDDHPDFMVDFRNIWADHADYVSKAYAGTGALKTDFTRTGKRSNQGLLNDGVNSVSRYVRNNFFDGDRQDAYDLVTGAYVAQRGGIPPLTDTRPLLIRSMPYVLVFALTMILAAVTLPRQSGQLLSSGQTQQLTPRSEWSIYSFLFLWFILALISGTFIWGNVSVAAAIDDQRLTRTGHLLRLVASPQSAVRSPLVRGPGLQDFQAWPRSLDRQRRSWPWQAQGWPWPQRGVRPRCQEEGRSYRLSGVPRTHHDNPLSPLEVGCTDTEQMRILLHQLSPLRILIRPFRIFYAHHDLCRGCGVDCRVL